MLLINYRCEMASLDNDENVVKTSLEEDDQPKRRLRRANSVARAEDITKEADKVRKSQPDKP